ncbi:hypothetical protein [Melittangium boletus]|uniref:Glycosyltransferase RgtA/B/C/D-like domain-containing protein n=1 Tax=Melittangium boletus DSM 14713 TaxID=1294270 RepID=A0A250I993_9BACT|nr:hypothetical protein [Melittangium boletus]ATB27778.1 hypothetical protein MEBOL_001223 [Melittangium boletus DSM 14713]
MASPDPSEDVQAAPVPPEPGAPSGVSSWLSLLGAGLGLALVSNAFTPVNSDLGWTLAFGREWANTGVFPQVNDETFTEPGHPLVMYQWAFNVLLYALHARWGAAGVIAAKWGWMALTVAGLAASIRAVATGGLVRMVVLLASVHFMWMGFELVRAQIVSFALIALVVYAGVSGNRRALWISAPLVGLSANFHGGFLAGWFLLAGLCGARMLEARLGWSGEKPPHWSEWTVLPGVAALSSLLTPYGPRLVTETLRLSGDPARLLDREWIPLWSVGTLVYTEKVALVLLALSLLLALVFLPFRRLRLWMLLVLAVGTSLSASRHLRMAPLLLAPVVAVSLEAALARVKTLRMDRLDALAVKLSGVLALALLALWALRVPEALGFIEWPFRNPANAIAVMRLNGLSGRVWNDFDWGGLLLWAAPDSRVACDGRHVMAYSGEMIATNINLGYDKKDPLATVERYGTELVLLRRDDPALPRLTSRFTVLYCDEDACLLSRRPEDIALLREGKLRRPENFLFVSDYFKSARGPDAAWDVTVQKAASRLVSPASRAEL